MRAITLSCSKNSNKYHSEYFTEKLDFSDNTLSIYQVFKSLGHFLDGHFLLRFMIISRTNYTVGSMSNLLNVLVLVLHDESCAYQFEKRRSYPHTRMKFFPSIVSA